MLNAKVVFILVMHFHLGNGVLPRKKKKWIDKLVCILLECTLYTIHPEQASLNSKALIFITIGFLPSPPAAFINGLYTGICYIFIFFLQLTYNIQIHIMRYVMRYIRYLALIYACITMLNMVDFQCPVFRIGIVYGPKPMVGRICVTANGEQIDVTMTYPRYFRCFLQS